MKTLKKGFTLIELLVVIAIIGILSSIVLASLSSARSKGTDAAIQSTVSSMRAQAELYYSNNSNSYGAPVTDVTTSPSIFTAGTSNLSAMISDLVKKTGGSTATYMDGAASSTGYIFAAKLNTGSICVDGTGNSFASSTGSVASQLNKSTGVCVR